MTTAWFLNEEGIPYEYDVDKQKEDFPNDYHTPHQTAIDAWCSIPTR